MYVTMYIIIWNYCVEYRSTEWGTHYFTDYQELLPGGASHKPLEEITKQVRTWHDET